MSDSEEKARNFLDRAAFYDGRVEALREVNELVMAALGKFEALGPVPTPQSPPYEVLAFQVKVASAAGKVFSELGEHLKTLLKDAEDERQLLMRDRVTDFEGGAMH